MVVGGLSAIGAGLYSIGIPKDSIVTYETAIKAGQYLVVAHGTSAEAAKARNILSTLKPTDLTDHVLEPAMRSGRPVEDVRGAGASTSAVRIRGGPGLRTVAGR